MTFLHGSAGLYGADRTLAVDAGILGRLGWQVRVLLPLDGPLRSLLSAQGTEVVHEPRLRVGRRRSGPRTLAPPLRLPVSARDAAVLVINTLALLPYAPAARLRQGRCLVFCHEILDGVPAQLARVVLSAAALPVVANSQATARWLSGVGVKPERVQVLYPSSGIDPAPAPPRQPQGRLTLGVLARLQPGKGHDLVLDALTDPDLRERLRVVFAGASFYHGDRFERRLLGRIAEAGEGAVAAGEVADPWALISRLDGLLVPSTAPEGFGLVPLEGAARGRRAIAARTGGLEESTGLCGGLLFEPGDVESLRRALRFAADRPDWFRSPPQLHGRLRRVLSGAQREAFWAAL